MATEGILAQISKRLDLFVPVAVIGIIVVMILPVHPFILDILLTLSISVSVMILFVSMLRIPSIFLHFHQYF